MSIDFRAALAGGGALLAVGAFVLGSFFGEGAKPVEHAVETAEEVGLAPGERFCHIGWTDKSARDEHSVVMSCERGNWVVILDPEGDFSHAFQKDTPGAEFVFDETRVPGW